MLWSVLKYSREIFKLKKILPVHNIQLFDQSNQNNCMEFVSTSTEKLQVAPTKKEIHPGANKKKRLTEIDITLCRSRARFFYEN
jgi:hypothetical protein